MNTRLGKSSSFAFSKSFQPVTTCLLIILLWQLVVWGFALPKYIVPTPVDVWEAFIHQPSVILRHTWVTLQEIVAGLVLGSVFGVVSALLMLLSHRLNRWMMPILIVSQAIPVFALAPVLMLWFGYGMASKVVMSAIIIFFPITVCCYDGLNNTPNGFIELGKTFHLSRWQMLWRVRFPAAMPALASGFRVSVVIAPIGAVIGEWVGASEGIGYFMLQSNARMQTADMFSGLVVLSMLSICLYFSVNYCLTRWIDWDLSD
ncbi:ABC transporter permease [Vibrio gangliei]|uniref:ABC transporter permease n=1 Tax=Vibrio gangliei TaxID=2077090 RepID=UPI001FEA5E38|nr:ABC transporter permease [Vibrio gangliei]